MSKFVVKDYTSTPVSEIDAARIDQIGRMIDWLEETNVPPFPLDDKLVMVPVPANLLRISIRFRSECRG